MSKGASPRPYDPVKFAESHDRIFRTPSTGQTCACRKCGGAMALGIATGQTCVGHPDFPGDTTPCTISPGGPGTIIPALKCEKCGHSITA